MTGDKNKKEKDPKETDIWAEAVEGVKPLGKIDKVKTATPRPRVQTRDRLQGPTTPPAPKKQSPFDPELYREISSGKARIDEKIDLHGFTEERAFTRLINAVEAAWQRGGRRLLVITGKGRGGTGAIRASLPKWLSSPGLTPYVSSFDYSHPRHGGDGAFYVILRKQR